MLNTKFLTPLLLTLACGPAGATTVAVTGSIEPSTCELNMGAGLADAFQYGDISLGSLNSASKTSLTVKTVALTVNCDGPTRVAIGAIDGKSDTNPFGRNDSAIDMSAAGGPTAGLPIDLFGLGTDQGSRIGGYSLALLPNSMKVDSVDSGVVSSIDSGTNWVSADHGFIAGATAPGFWSSWAKSGESAPQAGTNFEAILAIQPWIMSKKNLDLTRDLVLDGAATIELHYL
ncbi:Protein of uncharacterised function (DUF1120) [Yersinia enterocolitica]|uniref:DUF1120 domain-containing protein n=1 Tax=Yersinia mollaretii TaxID=33060 RepID=UPI0005E7CABD|nr:DUF1120 domain-containing protein [Yersinia mollaretii]CNK97215.1 Protein of uncharacterised function (DUF1120) [Yersinia enterocolitica]